MHTSLGRQLRNARRHNTPIGPIVAKASSTLRHYRAARDANRETVYAAVTESVSELFRELVSDIRPDYQADEESEPGTMSVTIGMDADSDSWSYQTGDNSYTGGAYGYAFWGVITLAMSDGVDECRAAARDAIDQIAEQIAECDDV